MNPTVRSQFGSVPVTWRAPSLHHAPHCGERDTEMFRAFGLARRRQARTLCGRRRAITPPVIAECEERGAGLLGAFQGGAGECRSGRPALFAGLEPADPDPTAFSGHIPATSDKPERQVKLPGGGLAGAAEDPALLLYAGLKREPPGVPHGGCGGVWDIANERRRSRRTGRLTTSQSRRVCWTVITGKAQSAYLLISLSPFSFILTRLKGFDERVPSYLAPSAGSRSEGSAATFWRIRQVPAALAIAALMWGY
jgi:hypothetical protein